MAQCHWITGSLHLQGNTVSLSTGIEMSENILTLKDEETILRPNIWILLHHHAASYHILGTQTNYLPSTQQTYFCHTTIWYNTKIQNG
jgi:hypothetical protein